MPPVVATLPEPDLTPITTSTPAIVTSVSAGLTIWPAALFAEQVPVRFAHSKLELANYTRVALTGIGSPERLPYISKCLLSSLKTLRDVIKRRAFDGAYYITGEDDYQKDDAVRQLIDGCARSGFAGLQSRHEESRGARCRNTRGSALDSADDGGAKSNRASRREAPEKGCAKGARSNI